MARAASPRRHAPVTRAEQADGAGRALRGGPALPHAAPMTTSEPGPRGAVLLLRVWQEGDGPAFRSRLVALDRSGQEQVVGAASTVDGVLAVVREWLTGAVEGARPDD